jgi:two-component system NtrC family sensor kinase
VNDKEVEARQPSGAEDPLPAEQVARRLQRERDLLSTIVENTHAQLAYLDDQFNFVRVNSAYARGSGYSEEELVGRNHFELFPDAEHQAIFERVRDTGEPAAFEARPVVFANRPGLGTTYWDWTLTPVKDGDGRVQGLVLSRIEVTGHHEALHRYADRLQLLRQSGRAILAAGSAEEMAEAVLRQVPQLMPCLRASVVLFDLETEHMSVLAVHAAGKTGVDKGWHGPMEREWMWVVEKLARGQAHVVDDVQALPSSSPLVRRLQAEGVRAHLYEPLFVRGKVIGSLNLGLSIPGPLASEQMEMARELAAQLAIGIQQARLREQVQRHAQELEHRVKRRTAALQVTEARFRAIFEQAVMGIALLDRGGRMVDTNPALQGMLGYDGQELRGMPVTQLIHPDDVAAADELYKELLAEKRSSYWAEQRCLRKDGRAIHANVTVSFVRPAGGQPRFAIAIVEDVTERKQAQEALIESEKLAATGRLAASFAHEINNPLQSVVGCLGLAQELLAGGKDASLYLQVASEEVERAARIVRQLRDLHRRSDPGKRTFVDVNALLEKVMLLTRKQCQERQIEVAWEAADDLPVLRLIGDRMQQVFLNLVLNAIEAMPGGGYLHISAARTDDPRGVRVRFADTGPGIPPDLAQRIFEPFESSKDQGLGLGLYVSKNIVEDHGGHIEVESETGKGTAFTVWLPA